MKVKDKYNDVLEKRRQQKSIEQAQAEDISADDSKPIFPNVADFDPDDPTDEAVTPTSEDVEVEPEEAPEPQIQIAPQHDDVEKALPKSHSFAEDDQKLKRELADVDHGELKTDVAVNKAYKKPPLSLLDPIKSTDQSTDRDLIKKILKSCNQHLKALVLK